MKCCNVRTTNNLSSRGQCRLECADAEHDRLQKHASKSTLLDEQYKRHIRLYVQRSQRAQLHQRARLCLQRSQHATATRDSGRCDKRSKLKKILRHVKHCEVGLFPRDTMNHKLIDAIVKPTGESSRWLFYLQAHPGIIAISC